MKKLGREFYNRDSLLVAKDLLGKLLVHEIDGKRISAKVVETEAYMGVDDKAAHSYGGKRTPRVEVMYGEPGYAYMFLIYGMHHCFNVVTQQSGNPQAVLIRAAEPAEGTKWMAQQRYEKPFDSLTKIQQNGLTNGPGKLCAALSFSMAFNGIDLCGKTVYFEDIGMKDFPIISTTRVGIDNAGEARDYAWRFYIGGNRYVSVK